MSFDSEKIEFQKNKKKQKKKFKNMDMDIGKNQKPNSRSAIPVDNTL
jgi:hypothetical protein